MVWPSRGTTPSSGKPPDDTMGDIFIKRSKMGDRHAFDTNGEKPCPPTLSTLLLRNLHDVFGEIDPQYDRRIGASGRRSARSARDERGAVRRVVESRYFATRAVAYHERCVILSDAVDEVHAGNVAVCHPSEVGPLRRLPERSSLGTPRSSLDATRLCTRRLAG
jgi:hypothetical protein